MSQGFWMPKAHSDSNDGAMAFNSTSRLESKRPHQCFMDGPETDLLPSKKQAMELPSNHSFLELLNSNPSQWGAASGLQTSSGHFGEQLFDLESSRMINYGERCVPLTGAGKMNVGRKVHENLLLNDSSFALSMSHMSEDLGSGIHYGGTKKVDVSQVKGSEHAMPVSMGHGYNKMEGHHLLMPRTYSKSDVNPISLALPSGVVGDDRIRTLGSTDGGESSVISMGNPHGIEDERASIGQTYRDDENNMSICHMTGKEAHSIMSMGQGYQTDNCAMSMGHMYNQEGNSSSVSVGNSYDKTENIMSRTIGKGQSTIISFGGCDDDANSSGRLIYNYEMLMGQPSLKVPNAIGNVGLVKSNSDGQIIVPGVGSNSKKREEHIMTKKSPSNNFPSNVRSLLSTGILDGVHVKYIAWSREELRGIIRGCGYLCGCPSCNYTKVINAYEFERHAGCKTKHPNNHIYFENGKTIYGTVQELRSTPQHMLFEVMQTITGSPINQKSFRLWKESYLAATRELQRIYGRDDGRVLS